MKARHRAVEDDADRQPDQQRRGERELDAGVRSARPRDRPDQRRHAERERDQQHEAEPQPRQRAVVIEQPKHRGRADRHRRTGYLAVVGGMQRARRKLRVQRRLRRVARDAVPAVEHEGRVPGAAVGRADRVGALRGGEEQRHHQPRQRDGDEHRALAVASRTRRRSRHTRNPNRIRAGRPTIPSKSLTLNARPIAAAAR